MPFTQPKGGYNTLDAAAYLNLSPGTLEVWRCLGRGPRYYKVGRRVIYRREDLDAYLAMRTVETRDTAEVLRGRHV